MPMKFLRAVTYPAALLALAALAACSSDESSEPADDTGIDTTTDGGADAAADTGSGTDASTDTGADTTPDATEDTTPSGPTLDEVAVQVFDVSCAGGGCHGTAPFAEGLNLANDADLATRLIAASAQSELPLITPGNADDSYLYLKCSGEHTTAGGTGARMPIGGVLSDEQLQLVADYINITLAPQ